jgi:hypothetical protein
MESHLENNTPNIPEDYRDTEHYASCPKPHTSLTDSPDSGKKIHIESQQMDKMDKALVTPSPPPPGKMSEPNQDTNLFNFRTSPINPPPKTLSNDYPRKFMSQTCRFWQKSGFCKKSRKCNFYHNGLHADDDLRRPSSPTP